MACDQLARGARLLPSTMALLS